MKESINIILNQYKKENISEEEAAKLIEDLYSKNYVYVPYYNSFPYSPSYNNEPTYKYEVTCSTKQP